MDTQYFYFRVDHKQPELLHSTHVVTETLDTHIHRVDHKQPERLYTCAHRNTRHTQTQKILETYTQRNLENPHV